MYIPLLQQLIDVMCCLLAREEVSTNVALAQMSHKGHLSDVELRKSKATTK